jgi:hypothetical protein
MNAPQSARRPGAAVVVQSLMWLWLIFLSVFVALGYQALQRPGRPGAAGFPPATPRSAGNWPGRDDRGHPAAPGRRNGADLKDTRQILEARAAQVEKSLSGYAAADDLQALRAEVEQIKARQPPHVPPHPPSRAHRARPPPPRPSCRCRSASSAPNCAPASAACPSRRAMGTSRPTSFRCCCPGMRSARGACRRSRATPQCSRPATRPAAWRFPDRSTP